VVEPNRFQELLADDMVRRPHERGVFFPLFTVESTVPKVVRIRPLTPPAVAGSFAIQDEITGRKAVWCGRGQIC
jgi:hypothetical protein